MEGEAMSQEARKTPVEELDGVIEGLSLVVKSQNFGFGQTQSLRHALGIVARVRKLAHLRDDPGFVLDRQRQAAGERA